MTVTPDTPQTIEGVTVSPINQYGNCRVRFSPDVGEWLPADTVRAMGLTVPEPTVPCRIGDQEFTLTREQVESLAGMTGWSGNITPAFAAAARAHVIADIEAGR